MSVTDVGGDKRIFLRKASGLIRTASGTDTFIYNLGVVSIGLGVGSMLYYGPAFYPQGDLVWGCIIAGVAMALISFGFITWTVTLPRSGGIYVFGSRILPPALALTMSLVEITAWLFYCAIAAYWIVILALAPMFAGLSLLTGNETFLTISTTMLEPWATFLIGAVILLISQVVLSFGMRFYLTLNKWVFLLAMASTILLIVTLAMYTREEFVTNLNALVGPSLGVPDAYNAIIASGKEKGWGEAGFDLWQTILVSNWPFLPLIGAAFSIAIGGEIKSVRQSQTIGMLGAVFTATVAFVITVWLAYKVFGFEFLGTAVFNTLSGEGGLTTPTDPSIALLTGILTGSPLITVLTSLGLALWMWMWIPAMHTFGVRAVVAWSFDRVAPAPLATISEKYHTPIIAITTTTVVNLIFMALFVFTPWFSRIVILIEAAVLAWSVVLAAGIFFPYLRPELYEKSPIANKTVFGLPIMTVACFLGFIAAQFYFWTLFSDPNAAGHDPTQVAIVGGVFLIGLAFYYVMKLIRRSQGVDVTLAFKEIPIE
ncbi:MAG: amino acid permease [Methyloceanibacter sp.]|uniref:amino acid permease n=1 Tax=Methyloceanibacter sp. TaxID=1965321 RepID=UPI003D6D9E93